MVMLNKKKARRRRGAAAVFSLVLLVVLIGFAALTLDVGAMYNARADLQNAADAAALAAASVYASPAMTQIRLGTATSGDIDQVVAEGRRNARQTGRKNWSFGSKGTDIPDQDITFGWIDLSSSTSAIDTSADPSKYNAVHVITRRSQEMNGPLQFFFASIFGKKSTTVTASAVAAYAGQATVYDVGIPDSASVWPFTIHENEFNRWVQAGTDNFDFNEDTGAIIPRSDGETEVRIYPDKLAPGNYGLLNIGSPNQSTNMLEGQIVNGVSAADLEIEIGTSELSFTDENGDPTGYDFSGNPGLKSALQASIQVRYGDVVAFFVHDGVSGGGSNVSYHITGLRFARVMHSTLSGKSRRGLWMQPVTYTGPGIVTKPGEATSGGGIVLVR